MKNFEQKVLNLVKKVPKGKVTTYRAIAEQLGYKGLARVVGHALKKNRFLVIIPCHRVVKSDQRLGGYKNGVEKKLHLLLNEGIKLVRGKIIDWDKVLFKF